MMKNNCLRPFLEYVAKILILCLGMAPILLTGQTNVSGFINANTTWTKSAGPYTLTGDVTVAQGVTLTIEKGTEIRFPATSRDLIIDGTLRAIGAVNDSIWFWGSGSSNGGSIVFDSTSTNNILDYVKIQWMGDNSSTYDAGIYADRADIKIYRTRIFNTESGQDMVVTPNTPARIDFQDVRINTVYVEGGSIQQSGLWENFGGSYVIDGDIYIDTSAVVTWGPGVKIQMPSFADDITVRGSLKALGQPGDTIIIWGSDPGLNNYGGTIYFAPGSRGNILDHVRIFFLGDYSSQFDAAVYVDSAELKVSDSWIYASQNEENFRVTARTPQLLTFLNNNIETVHVAGGFVQSDATWAKPDNSYTLEANDDIFVSKNATLTLLPGTEIHFPNSCSILYVEGALIAEGTPAKPIRFWGSNTSQTVHGGGIQFYNGSAGNRMNYVILEKLGEGSCSPNSSVYVGNAELTLTNSKIIDGEQYGVYFAAGQLTLLNNCFESFASTATALYNGSTQPLDAANNYWGDPAGPRHTSNPNGLGARVTGNVVLSPFQPSCNTLIQNDLAATQLIQPVSGCGPVPAQQVTVQITNPGIQPQKDFTISYRLNGGPPVNDTFPGTLAGGQSAEFTFPGTVNMTNPGTYSFQIYTSLNGDQNPNNDGKTVDIERQAIFNANTTPAATICNGESAVLQSEGGQSYQWSNGQAGSLILVFPSTNSTYYVTVTNALGCTDVDTVVVTVKPLPTQPVITGGPSILCPGATATFASSVTTNIIWSNGATTPSITVSSPGSYSVTHIGANGCSSVSNTVQVTNATPALLSPSTPVSICTGQSVTLTVFLANAYQWSTGATTSSITVSPFSTTTYTVTATNAAGCTYVLSNTVTVLPNIIPGPVSNLLPPDGATNLILPVTLSWSPGSNAGLYDVFVWQQGTAKPAQANYPGLTKLSLQPANLLPGVTYRWQVVPRNCQPGAASPEQSFTVAYLPDLIVQNIQIPSNAFSGLPIQVTWRVRNGSPQGGTGSQTWYDAAYLSADQTLNAGDLKLGSVKNQAALLPGEAYNASVQYTVPECMEGSYYIIVVADRGNDLSESNENNNRATSTTVLPITLTPPPDLRVTRLIPPAVGNTMFEGGSGTIEWTVENQGFGPTRSGGWLDRVYVSRDSFDNPNTRKLLASVQHYGNLAKDSSYDAGAFITLPKDSAGILYLYVLTDFQDKEEECNFENNNRRRSDAITVIAVKKPDFIVESIQAPANASNLETVPLTCVIRNKGENFNGTVWQAITLSDQAGKAGQGIGTFPISGFFPLDSAITVKTNVTIPAGVNGARYLVAVADRDDDVFEGAAGEGNNLNARPIVIQSPDVRVLNPGAPPSAVAGQTINVQWTVLNNGPGALYSGGLTDEITLSGAVPASGTYKAPTTLLKDQSQPRTTTFALPVNLPAGNYILNVKTNSDNGVFENGQTANNTSVNVPIAITAANTPDLNPTTPVMPAQVEVCKAAELTYEVWNNGTAGALGAWEDALYLSAFPNWNPNSAILLASKVHSQLVANGTKYQDVMKFQLPAGLPQGTYYLYLASDVKNQVYEANWEGNNVKRSNAFNVLDCPKIDLALQNVTAPCPLTPGQAAALKWEVQNLSLDPSTAAGWEDRLYLSANTTFEPTDIPIAAWPHAGGLSGLQSYARLENFTVPPGQTGTFYLILVADAGGANAEINLDNNRRLLTCNNNPVTVVYPPAPDLQMTGLTAPSAGVSGQPIDIAYIVKNNGPGEAKGGWKDGVYLSTDQTVSGDDIFLGKQNRPAPLPSQATYNDALQVFLPAGVATGNYWLLARADDGQKLPDNNPANNTLSRYIAITQPLPADLIVEAVESAGKAVSGAILNVDWEVVNQGDNPASGYMQQGIYLSENETWDASDVLLGVWKGFFSLDPGDTQACQLGVRMEGVKDGEYYVLVKTDLIDNIPEQDETNNTGAGEATLAVEIPLLPVGVLTPAQLPEATLLYYRIEVPANLENETMRVALNSPDAGAVNELYLRYGDIPGRSAYDFGFDAPFSKDQAVLIPKLKPGNYYLLAYAVSAGTAPQNITLLAEIVPFALESVFKNKGGNTGKVTVKLKGTRFDPGMQVTLQNGPGGAVIPAEKVQYVSPVTAFVTFNLKDRPTGIYDLAATSADGSDASTLLDGFEVRAGTIGQDSLLITCTDGDGATLFVLNALEPLDFEAQYPAAARPNQIINLTFRYENAGDVDVPLPGLIVSSIGKAPIANYPDGLKQDLQELRLEFQEKDGPEDILRPGAVATRTIFAKAIRQLRFNLY